MLYEIYCTKYSQIIDAEDLLNAVKIFGNQNPTEEIIMAESIKHRTEEENFISSNPLLSADATNWKEKYEKCIAVIKRFDAGIIGMYDL